MPVWRGQLHAARPLHYQTVGTCETRHEQEGLNLSPLGVFSGPCGLGKRDEASEAGRSWPPPDLSQCHHGCKRPPRMKGVCGMGKGTNLHSRPLARGRARCSHFLQFGLTMFPLALVPFSIPACLLLFFRHQRTACISALGHGPPNRVSRWGPVA